MKIRSLSVRFYRCPRWFGTYAYVDVELPNMDKMQFRLNKRNADKETLDALYSGDGQRLFDYLVLRCIEVTT